MVKRKGQTKSKIPAKKSKKNLNSEEKSEKMPKRKGQSKSKIPTKKSKKNLDSKEEEESAGPSTSIPIRRSSRLSQPGPTTVPTRGTVPETSTVPQSTVDTVPEESIVTRRSTRKHPIVDTVTKSTVADPIQVTSTVTRRPGGRARKNPAVDTVTQDTVDAVPEESTVTRRSVGRQRKLTVPQSTVADPSQDTSTVTRISGGRPRKCPNVDSVPQSTVADPSQDTSTVTRRSAGRPGKHPITVTQSTVEPTVTRNVGRLRKRPSVDTVTQDTVNASPEESTVTRRSVGRSRRHPKVNTVTQSTVDTVRALVDNLDEPVEQDNDVIPKPPMSAIQDPVATVIQDQMEPGTSSVEVPTAVHQLEDTVLGPEESTVIPTPTTVLPPEDTVAKSGSPTVTLIPTTVPPPTVTHGTSALFPRHRPNRDYDALQERRAREADKLKSTVATVSPTTVIQPDVIVLDQEDVTVIPSEAELQYSEHTTVILEDPDITVDQPGPSRATTVIPENASTVSHNQSLMSRLSSSLKSLKHPLRDTFNPDGTPKDTVESSQKTTVPQDIAGPSTVTHNKESEKSKIARLEKEKESERIQRVMLEAIQKMDEEKRKNETIQLAELKGLRRNRRDIEYIEPPPTRTFVSSGSNFRRRPPIAPLEKSLEETTVSQEAANEAGPSTVIQNGDAEKLADPPGPQNSQGNSEEAQTSQNPSQRLLNPPRQELKKRNSGELQNPQNPPSRHLKPPKPEPEIIDLSSDSDSESQSHRRDSEVLHLRLNSRSRRDFQDSEGQRRLSGDGDSRSRQGNSESQVLRRDNDLDSEDQRRRLNSRSQQDSESHQRLQQSSSGNQESNGSQRQNPESWTIDDSEDKRRQRHLDSEVHQQHQRRRHLDSRIQQDSKSQRLQPSSSTPQKSKRKQRQNSEFLTIDDSGDEEHQSHRPRHLDLESQRLQQSSSEHRESNGSQRQNLEFLTIEDSEDQRHLNSDAQHQESNSESDSDTDSLVSDDFLRSSDSDFEQKLSNYNFCPRPHKKRRHQKTSKDSESQPETSRAYEERRERMEREDVNAPEAALEAARRKLWSAEHERRRRRAQKPTEEVPEHLRTFPEKGNSESRRRQNEGFGSWRRQGFRRRDEDVRRPESSSGGYDGRIGFSDSLLPSSESRRRHDSPESNGRRRRSYRPDSRHHEERKYSEFRRHPNSSQNSEYRRQESPESSGRRRRRHQESFHEDRKYSESRNLRQRREEFESQSRYRGRSYRDDSECQRHQRHHRHRDSQDSESQRHLNSRSHQDFKPHRHEHSTSERQESNRSQRQNSESPIIVDSEDQRHQDSGEIRNTVIHIDPKYFDRLQKTIRKIQKKDSEVKIEFENGLLHILGRQEQLDRVRKMVKKKLRKYEKEERRESRRSH